MPLEGFHVKPTRARLAFIFWKVGSEITIKPYLPRWMFLRNLIRRRHGHNALHRQSRGHQQRQRPTHRKPDEINLIRCAAQKIVAIFNRSSPIRPARANHILRTSRMSSQPHTKTGKTEFAVEVFPHPAHFLGRAREAVYQQNSRASARKKERFSCRNGLGVHAPIISMRPRNPNS